MQRESSNNSSRWGQLNAKFQNKLEFMQSDPKLAIKTLSAKCEASLRKKKTPKILVGTHHKVLTVYMSRVFKKFAQITNRTISTGMGENVNYNADILFDHHSQFDFSKVDGEYLGIHFRRDPRDIVVSARFYHKHSSEPQLHVARDEFGGKTYQEHINSMNSMEEVFLFELDHSAGMNIKHMLEWDYTRGFVELKYEDLIIPEGGQVFRKAINDWPLSKIEKSLLESLFNHYSIFNSNGKKGKHIRDPKSKQFKENFSEKLHHEFDIRFGDAPSKLGYS